MDFSERPRIPVPKRSIDYILDVLSLLCVVFSITYTATHYSELPDMIPRHFNAAGEADGFSKKAIAWVLVGIQAALGLGLYALTKAPYLLSSTKPITEENAPYLYPQGLLVLRLTNMLCMVLFSYIVFSSIQVALGEKAKLDNLFFWVLVGLIIIAPLALSLFFHQQNKRLGRA